MPAFVPTSHAADKFELQWTDVIFDAGSDDNEWIFTAQDSVDIKNAVSEDESIATVTWRPRELVFYPVKEGSTNIIVTGENDQVINVSVSVTASYYEKDLKDRTSFYKGDYAEVTYKGKTYKKKITKDYDGKYKTVAIKIKKKLKSNSEITVKIVNKDRETLLEDTVKLEKWKYYVPDEDEDDDESDEYGY